MASVLIAIPGARLLLRTLRTALAAAGHIVTTTENGVEARQLSATYSPDCVVVDTRLWAAMTWPDQQGTAHAPRVVLIAQDEAERVRVLAQGDAAAVLVQPVQLDDLWEVLRLHAGCEASQVSSPPEYPGARVGEPE